MMSFRFALLLLVFAVSPVFLSELPVLRVLIVKRFGLKPKNHLYGAMAFRTR